MLNYVFFLIYLEMPQCDIIMTIAVSIDILHAHSVYDVGILFAY